MTLTEFLLARIAEDEALVHEVLSHYQRPQNLISDMALGFGEVRGDPCVRMGEGRMLAECEAKRRIVESFQIADEQWRGIAAISGRPSATTAAFESKAVALMQQVGFLAEVYADHPDYREEWRP